MNIYLVKWTVFPRERIQLNDNKCSDDLMYNMMTHRPVNEGGG